MNKKKFIVAMAMYAVHGGWIFGSSSERFNTLYQAHSFPPLTRIPSGDTFSALCLLNELRSQAMPIMDVSWGPLSTQFGRYPFGLLFNWERTDVGILLPYETPPKGYLHNDAMLFTRGEELERSTIEIFLNVFVTPALKTIKAMPPGLSFEPPSLGYLPPTPWTPESD